MEKQYTQKRSLMSYLDFINMIYHFDNDEDPVPEGQYSSRSITFQVTDDCPMCCTYCYQGHKGHRKMSKEVAKKGVDLLFKMYEEDNSTFINRHTKAVVLDFIGGEPFMAVDIMDYICTYFVQKCLETDHPWLYTWRASTISNGALYFEPEVQNFLKKFKDNISFGITLDGPKEIHDACRIYHDGHGNFDDAYKAFKHFNETYYKTISTKVTIAPENIHNLNTIVDFYRSIGVKDVNANCVFEAKWTVEDAKVLYNEMKLMANKLLKYKDSSVSLFNEDLFVSIPTSENNNWCGGTGNMLAFDPDGIAYPCLRYMPSSLGDDVPPIILGSVDGIFETEEHKHIKEYLDSITRRSQSTDECWNCPIARGCSWCSAWNYQETGLVNKRSTNICIMHKARSLANAYYWNHKYISEGREKRMPVYLPREEAEKIISPEEYDELIILSRCHS